MRSSILSRFKLSVSWLLEPIGKSFSCGAFQSLVFNFAKLSLQGNLEPLNCGCTRQRYAPCSRSSRRRLPPAARGALVFAHPSPQGSLKGTRRPRTSAAARLPLGCGRRIILVPSFASQGRYTPRYAVSAAVGGPVNAALRPSCPRLMPGCQQL